MPYYYTDYYADVRGYTKIKVNFPAETASWATGHVVRIGSPVGTAFTYNHSSTLFYDNQPNTTMYSDISPTTSGAFSRAHPKLGRGVYLSNSQGGDAFGVYSSVVGDSPVLNGVTRDTIPASNEFYVLDTNLTSAITVGTKIYNPNVILAGLTAIDLTSSWRNIPNTTLTGTAIGNAFTSVKSSNEEKFLIYSFGGENATNDWNNYIFVCTASTSNSGLKLNISPWYRIDNNKNLWPGDVPANAFPSAGGTPNTIPISVGITDGAACTDTTNNFIFFGGGIRKLFSGSSDITYGSDSIYGWNYDPTTGLITGTSFFAGKMPMGRYGHEMFVANGFLYVVGGQEGSYPAGSPTQVTGVFHNHIQRAFIRSNGELTDWAECLYEIPFGMSVQNTGTGIVEGASFIYPDDASAVGSRYVYLIGGLKQYFNGSTYVTKSSAQVWTAELNYTGSAVYLPNQYRLGVDNEWKGPSQGEYLTVGAQIGPTDIKPVFPLLDDVYQKIIVRDTSELPKDKTLIGYRPGLRGTDIGGTWQIRIATTPGDFNPEGDAETVSWARLTSSQVYIRQLRIEFLVDSTSGYSDLQFFNPARERLYRKSSLGFREGRKLLDIISGTQYWDAGVSYIYAYQQPEYGRSTGITSNSSSDDYAVFTRLTGALDVALTGTPDWFLNPPPGEGMPGLPYIPMSSASIGEYSTPLNPDSTNAQMAAATVNQQLPVPSDNTLPAYLSRIAALRTTQELYEKQLRVSNTGSYF